MERLPLSLCMPWSHHEFPFYLYNNLMRQEFLPALCQYGNRGSEKVWMAGWCLATVALVFPHTLSWPALSQSAKSSAPQPSLGFALPASEVTVMVKCYAGWCYFGLHLLF